MKRGRQKTKLDMASFRRDVETGSSVAALVEKYGIAKSTFYRLKAEMSGRCEATPMVIAENDEEQAGDCEEEDAYTLNIDVPANRLDELIAGLSNEELRGAVLQMAAQDKAQIFQSALQGRMNEDLIPMPVDLPRLVANG